MTADRSATRPLLLAQALLWLAAAGASSPAVLLCIDPADGTPWSAETGAVLFALLGIYAAAGCLGSLCDMMHCRPARRI